MRVELCLEQGSTRRWHVDLLERLGEQPGLEVGIRWAPPEAKPLPSCVETLLALERTIHKLAPGSFGRVGPDDLAHHVGRGGTEPDIVLDLTGGRPSAGTRRWRLTFDGAKGEVPLVGALLSGRTPVVAITDVEADVPIAAGHPGTETPHIVAAALEDVLTPTISLIVAATRPGATSSTSDAVAVDFGCGSVARFGARAVARAVLHRLRKMLRRAPPGRRRLRAARHSSARIGAALGRPPASYGESGRSARNRRRLRIRAAGGSAFEAGLDSAGP